MRDWRPIGLAIALMVAGGAAEAATAHTIELHVDPRDIQQKFEGWGTTLAWAGNFLIPGHGKLDTWAQWDSVMQSLFSPRELGFNIVRYNIGGGENPAYRYLFNINPDFMIEGFSREDRGWNWTADSGQIAMMMRARSLGVDLFEAFSNSPPYFMLKSQSVSGAPWMEDHLNGESGASDNLMSDHYADFASYLADVVQHFRDVYGIVFRTVDPVNEPRPETRYWLFKQNFPNGKVQEGCHFSVKNQDRIMIETVKALRARGLATDVSGPDETSIDFTRTSFLGYSDEGRKAVAQINTHGYIGGDRLALRRLAKANRKRLWMSEDGLPEAGLSAALRLASQISVDLKVLGAQAWIIWQPDSGLMTFPGRGKIEFIKGYSAVKQYSHFIREGAVILNDAGGSRSRYGDDDTLVTYHPKTHRLSVVTVNQDAKSGKMIAIDLSRFHRLGKSAEVYRTDASHDCMRTADLSIDQGRLMARAAPLSIVTIELDAF